MRINISKDEFLKAVEQANTTTIGAEGTKSLFELEEFVMFIKGAAMLGADKKQAPDPNDLVTVPWYKLLAMMGGTFTAGFAAGYGYQDNELQAAKTYIEELKTAIRNQQDRIQHLSYKAYPAGPSGE